MPNPLLAALCIVVVFLPFLLGPLIVMITESAAGLVIGCIGWVLSLGITMLLYMYSFEQNPGWWNDHGMMPIAVFIAIVVAAISAIMIFAMAEDVSLGATRRDLRIPPRKHNFCTTSCSDLYQSFYLIALATSAVNSTSRLL